MMDDVVKPRHGVDVQQYKGTPRRTKGKEKSNWQKFLSFIAPWLNEKRLLGERYLEAQVGKLEAEMEKNQAEAINQLADATLKIQQAKDIARKASEKEVLKFNAIGDKIITDQDISNHIAEIENRINYLSSIHGFKIDIHIEKGSDDK